MKPRAWTSSTGKNKPKSRVYNHFDYSFEAEIKEKYDQNTYDLFADIFCYLPLVYIINKKVMVTHGGLFSKDGVKISDLKKIDRIREPPDEGLMTELLWSDPSPLNGRQPSKRGVGLSFGPDVAHKFLDENKLGKIQS